MPATMPRDDVRHVEANGLRFAFLEQGNGPLVLLLHGFPDTPHSWDDLRPRLAARGYRVVAPWLRGYAPTQIPDRDTDLPTLGRDVHALIAALGETSAIVVGHDWGAAAAYTAALLGPADPAADRPADPAAATRITQLVTIAIPHPGSLRPSPRQLWGVRHFLAYKLSGAAQRFAARDFAALPALYRRWSPTWNVPDAELAPVRAVFADRTSLDAAFGYYRTLPLYPPAYLRQPIAVPTIAFAGLDDTLIPPAQFHAAQRLFTGPYTVEVMRGGHFMHREHPDEFAAKLLAHL